MPAATTAPALSNRLRRPMTYSMAVTPAAGLPRRCRSFHPIGSGSVAAPLRSRAAATRRRRAHTRRDLERRLHPSPAWHRRCDSWWQARRWSSRPTRSSCSSRSSSAPSSRGSRRRCTELLDALAPAGILALAIGRLGCFLGGCCYGRPTALPWGVVFPEVGPPARHPLQLYSAALDLLLVCVLLRSSGPPGVVAARACLGLGVVRFLLE